MPITKSAKKALRQSKKKKRDNTGKKEAIKRVEKEIKKLLGLGKKEDALKLAPKAYKTLDKAVKVNVLKKNTANRRKSRIMKMFKKTPEETKTSQ